MDRSASFGNGKSVDYQRERGCETLFVGAVHDARISF